jgi:hypothetical protein
VAFFLNFKKEISAFFEAVVEMLIQFYENGEFSCCVLTSHVCEIATGRNYMLRTWAEEINSA